MTFSKLLIYIALTILGFWLLGFAIELAAWVIYIVILIVAILSILWLVQQWYNDSQARNHTTKAKTASRKKPVKSTSKTVKVASTKVPAKPRRKAGHSTKQTTTKPKKKSTK